MLKHAGSLSAVENGVEQSQNAIRLIIIWHTQTRGCCHTEQASKAAWIASRFTPSRVLEHAGSLSTADSALSSLHSIRPTFISYTYLNTRLLLPRVPTYLKSKPTPMETPVCLGMELVRWTLHSRYLLLEHVVDHCRRRKTKGAARGMTCHQPHIPRAVTQARSKLVDWLHTVKPLSALFGHIS